MHCSACFHYPLYRQDFNKISSYRCNNDNCEAKKAYLHFSCTIDQEFGISHFSTPFKIDGNWYYLEFQDYVASVNVATREKIYHSFINCETRLSLISFSVAPMCINHILSCYDYDCNFNINNINDEAWRVANKLLLASYIC